MSRNLELWTRVAGLSLAAREAQQRAAERFYGSEAANNAWMVAHREHMRAITEYLTHTKEQ